MSMVAGWYPDPFSSAGFLRWWDGTQWTSQTMLPATLQSKPAPMPSEQAAPLPVAPFPLASWGTRFAAWLIDVVLVGIVVVPIYVVVLWPAFSDLLASLPADGTEFPADAITTFQQRALESSLVLSLVFVAISFVYFVPQNVRYGRTVGKRVCAIRIRAFADDRNPTWREAVLRWGVYTAGTLVAGGIFTLIDCLWPLWDKPWKQALHDKVAKTLVVPNHR